MLFLHNEIISDIRLT